MEGFTGSDGSCERSAGDKGEGEKGRRGWKGSRVEGVEVEAERVRGVYARGTKSNG